MQHQVQIGVEAEDDWAQGAALRARNELLAAAALAATAILILFLRLQRQEHIAQLEVAERTALRESEDRFRALTEQSTDIILIADPSGQIRYASPSVHTVLAVLADSLVGTSMIDLVHPDDLAKSMSPGPRSAAYGQNPIVEFRLRHADGKWLYFECVVRNLIQHKKRRTGSCRPSCLHQFRWKAGSADARLFFGVRSPAEIEGIVTIEPSLIYGGSTETLRQLRREQCQGSSLRAQFAHALYA
jgi:PAS domain S-box-containing protein